MVEPAVMPCDSSELLGTICRPLNTETFQGSLKPSSLHRCAVHIASLNSLSAILDQRCVGSFYKFWPLSHLCEGSGFGHPIFAAIAVCSSVTLAAKLTSSSRAASVSVFVSIDSCQQGNFLQINSLGCFILLRKLSMCAYSFKASWLIQGFAMVGDLYKAVSDYHNTRRGLCST